MPKPIPVPDAVTKPFWDAVNQRRLVAQYCLDCARYQHPPLPRCQWCGRDSLEFRPLSGKGVIYSWQVMHDTRVVPMQEYQPFLILVVEAEESPDVWFLSNLPESAREQVEIGAPVEVEFEEIRPDVFLPQFRLIRQ